MGGPRGPPMSRMSGEDGLSKSLQARLGRAGMARFAGGAIIQSIRMRSVCVQVLSQENGWGGFWVGVRSGSSRSSHASRRMMHLAHPAGSGWRGRLRLKGVDGSWSPGAGMVGGEGWGAVQRAAVKRLVAGRTAGVRAAIRVHPCWSVAVFSAFVLWRWLGAGAAWRWVRLWGLVGERGSSSRWCRRRSAWQSRWKPVLPR